MKALAAGTLFIPGVAGTLFKKMIEGPLGVKDGCLERLTVDVPKPGAICFEILYLALQFKP